jgi:hypothetical protein
MIAEAQRNGDVLFDLLPGSSIGTNRFVLSLGTLEKALPQDVTYLAAECLQRERRT